MSPLDPTAGARVWRLRKGNLTEEEALLIVEEPLEILVDGESYGIIMRTPGDDRALAAGFCLSEGLIDHIADVGTIAYCDDEARNQVAVTRLRRPGGEDGAPGRPPAAGSSCGLCGRDLIGELAARLPEDLPDFQTSVGELLALGRKLQAAQQYFRSTGASHAAAIFGAEGELLAFGEDVGRHNALDKAIGKLLLADRLARGRVALLSGRCSFEMVSKAARARLPVVAGVSAPTHLAVELAAWAGMALVGFVREETLTIYVDAGRIADLRPAEQTDTEVRDA